MYKYFNNIIPLKICNSILSHSKRVPPSFVRHWEDRIDVQPKWLLENKDFIKTLFFINNLATTEYNSVIYPEFVTINKWPLNSAQNLHIDDSRNSTVYTSITYLNQDYEGGKTYINEDNFVSRNNIGDTLMFDGKRYKHGVTPVTKGTRYVLSIWYSKNINDFILNL